MDSAHDRLDAHTGEAERGRRHRLGLTYPNIVAEPGEVLLRAVVVADLLITPSCGRRGMKGWN